MHRSEVQRVLTGRGWLAEVEPALAAAVIDAGRLVKIGKGQPLFNPGDDPGGMYGVAKGGMIMAARGRNGLPLPGHIARACHWFGYASVFDKQRRTLTIWANEPSVLLHVPLAEFSRLKAQFPASERSFGRLATIGEAGYLALAADLLIRNTDRRIASVLLRVSGAEPPPFFPGHRPTNEELSQWYDPRGASLTQTLLAEMANTSPNTVARFVERATSAGWIDWRYGRVRMLDAIALADFAAGD
jgi:CRP-like cAMP-binding protein